MSALELSLLLDLDLMARDVLTKLRWLRRLSMMMLCSAITLMTRDATPPMSPPMSPSRRRSARRTTGRAVSLNTRRLLSLRLLRSAELPLLRTVMSRDLRFAELNMSLSAGPSRRFMMLRMMLLSAQLRLRRSVRMEPLDTPPTPSALSGPRRSALSPRSR